MRTHRRHVALLAVLLAALASAPSGLAATVTLRSGNDGWTHSHYPNRSFGTQKVLRVNAKPIKRTFVRFTVPSLPGPVEGAVLRLHTRTGAPSGFRVHATGTGWHEKRLTHRNAPALRTLVATVAPSKARGTWVTVDVSSAIAGPGTYSFALTSPSARADIVFSAKESGMGPRLVVTTGSGGPGPGSPGPGPGPTAVAPANTSLPAVSGLARQGQTLTASNGSWTGTAPITYARQWRRCDAGGGNCANIGGATGTSYAAVAADVGRTLRVRVTASNAAGQTVATSAQTAVVTAPPTGQPTPGTVITTSTPWNCRGNIATFGPLPVKVISTIGNAGPNDNDNAINLRGCYGDGNPNTIDLILDIRGNGKEIGTSYDAVRIGQNARDLVVTGNAECGAKSLDPSIHQDIVQALSGNNITFVDFTSGDPETGRWTCWGAGGGWYVTWANADIPTDLICLRCKLATYNQNLRIDQSIRSGARDSTFGYSRSYGIFIGPQAINPINTNNKVIRY